jgi:hypothetical protein
MRWLEEFEEKLVNRFPPYLEIEYRFGIFNSRKFRIWKPFGGRVQFMYQDYYDDWFSVTNIKREDLQEDICKNMQGIINAFKKEEERQIKRRKQGKIESKEREEREKVREKVCHAKIKELDLK